MKQKGHALRALKILDTSFAELFDRVTTSVCLA
jgi:hypothetical protein